MDDLYNTGITATEQPCVSNFINCQFYMNHLNGITATESAVVNLYGENTAVYDNGNCGMYVYQC